MTFYERETITNDALKSVLSVSWLTNRLMCVLHDLAETKEQLAALKHERDCMEAELSREIDELKGIAL